MRTAAPWPDRPHRSRTSHFAAGVLILTAVVPAGSLHAQDREDWRAPARAIDEENPLPHTEEVIAEGRRLFVQSCAACHGNEGKGDGPAAIALDPKPRDLTGQRVAEQADGEIHWKIRNGKPPMPGFAAALAPKQVWQIVHFLRDLGPERKTTRPEPEPVDQPAAAISGLLPAYLGLSHALRSDRPQPAAQKLLRASLAVGELRTERFGSGPRTAWCEAWDALRTAARAVVEAEDDRARRRGFATFSAKLATVVARFGHREERPLVLFSCPDDPEDAGLSWLQRQSRPSNPYPGFPRDCAESVKTFPAEPVRPPQQNGEDR